MARPRKELPTDPDELKQILIKLKDKEIRLEADLALRQQPTLEPAIISICIAIHDVKQADIALKVTQLQSGSVDNTKRLEQLTRLIKVYEANIAKVTADESIKKVFYEQKIESCKMARRDLAKGADTKYLRLKADRELAVQRLRKELSRQKKHFEDAGFNFQYFLPQLEKFVPELFT